MKNEILKDISAVIQGPLDDRTHEAIDALQEFGEVIVSTWKNEDLSLLEPAKGNFQLTLSSYPKNHDTFRSGYYEFQTTSAGFLEAKLPYIFKFRSDELYPDLEKIILNFCEEPSRIHTTDNGFWNNRPASFSGHLYLGERETLTAGLLMAKHWSRGEIDAPINHPSVEQAIGYYLMAARGIRLSREGWKKAFRENVFITPCSELKGHLHSGQSFSSFKFRRATNYPEGRPDNHDPKKLYTHHSQIV